MAASQAPVVSNTTPLINLVGVGQLDLLPRLYGDVTIADIVRDEFAAGMTATDPNLDSIAWMHVVPAVSVNPSLPAQLGAGEMATISLALVVNARAVLLDEAYGRRLAKQLGLPIVGTLGVLLAAKQTGLLPAVGPIIDEMILQGRRLSPRL